VIKALSMNKVFLSIIIFLVGVLCGYSVLIFLGFISSLSVDLLIISAKILKENEMICLLSTVIVVQEIIVIGLVSIPIFAISSLWLTYFIKNNLKLIKWFSSLGLVFIFLFSFSTDTPYPFSLFIIMMKLTLVVPLLVNIFLINKISSFLKGLNKNTSYIYIALSIVFILITVERLGLYQKNHITVNGLVLLKPSLFHYSAFTLEDSNSYWGLFKGTIRPKYSFNLKDNEVVSINFDNLYMNEEISLKFVKEKAYQNYVDDTEDKLEFGKCILEQESNNTSGVFQAVGRHKIKDILFTISSSNEFRIRGIQDQICK